jgi:hypothetical protein
MRRDRQSRKRQEQNGQKQRGRDDETHLPSDLVEFRFE